MKTGVAENLFYWEVHPPAGKRSFRITGWAYCLQRIIHNKLYRAAQKNNPRQALAPRRFSYPLAGKNRKHGCGMDE